MDQLRTFLSWLKKHHFWVLSVLIALIGLVCWWSAAGTMRDLYDKNEKTITAEFTNLDTLQSDPFHPNNDINEQQGEEIDKLKKDVDVLWQQLYDRQSKNVLKWPAELQQWFRDYVEKLKPFADDIPRDIVIDGRRHNMREHYQNYIFRHFPELPKKIGAEAISEDETGAITGSFSRSVRGSSGPEGQMSMPTVGQTAEVDDYICVWLPEDQSIVRRDLEFTQQPSSLRIWVTQENLWVYHTMLDVIKNTNDAAGASRPSNAAVRTIVKLEVGRPAAQYSRTPGRIQKLAAAAAPAVGEGGIPSEFPTGPDGQMPGASSPEFRNEFSGASGEGQMSEAAEQQFLLSNRYLSEDGRPMPFGAAPVEGETAAEPVAAVAVAVDPATFGKEYKRLPVRMVLEMDQRHLPRLLAECAVQPLQIEVQEVRINAPDAIGQGGGGMSGFREGGGGGGGGGSEFLPTLTGDQPFDPQPNIVTVVVQGVIYIFNKPDKELLKPTSETDPQVATAQ